MPAVRINNKIKAQQVLGQATKSFENPEGLAAPFTLEEIARQGEGNEGKSDYIIVAKLNRPLAEFPEADQRILSTMHVEEPEDDAEDDNAPQDRAEGDHTSPMTMTQEQPEGTQDGTQPPAPEVTPATPQTAGNEDVTRYDGRVFSAPIPVGAGRKRLPVLNDIALPATWTETRRIWDKLDEISKRENRVATLGELKAGMAADGYSDNTLSTQYARWAKFWGISEEERKAARKAAKENPSEEASEEAKRLKALKDEEKRLERETKAIERQEEKRLKDIEKAELKAAEQRSKAEARELERQQKSAENAKRREEQLAANEAVRQERARNAITEQEAKVKAKQEALEARKREFERREAEAKARIAEILSGKVSADAPAADGKAPQDATAEGAQTAGLATQ